MIKIVVRRVIPHQSHISTKTHIKKPQKKMAVNRIGLRDNIRHKMILNDSH